MRVLLVMTATVLLVGCGTGRRPVESQPLAQQQNQSELRSLLSRTDVLVVKNFYPPAGIATTSREYTRPGYLSVQAAIIYEPGKEAERRKGVQISVLPERVVSPGDTTYLGEGGAVSLLDEDEVKDLIQSLDYMLSSATRWASTSQRGPHVEIEFQSKDALDVSVFNDKDRGNVLFVESGSKFVGFPMTKALEFQQNLRAAISILDTN